MNILSIDWDYFVDASTLERLYMFPDSGNENLTGFLKKIVWAGIYAANSNLELMGVLQKDIDKLKPLIKDSINEETALMIRDSHSHIIDFIESNLESDDEKINLFNIDFHHDVYDVETDGINAGNWMKHLINRRKGEYTWIARAGSDMRELRERRPELKVITEDIEAIKGIKWDAIFICRSDMWSPPHLDDTFAESFRWLTEILAASTEDSMFESRYNQSFIDEVNFDQEAREKLMNEWKKG